MHYAVHYRKRKTPYLHPATPFFAFGEHLLGGTQSDDSHAPLLHVNTVWTLLQRGTAVAGHASPARGVPGSQWTPALSALQPPGPRHVSETFQTPPMQVSSSKPPGAQATASFASLAAQAFPAAGGPAG